MCSIGTAKSELSRRLNAVVGGTYFERLLTRFSVPEELFGPLSMRGATPYCASRRLEYAPVHQLTYSAEHACNQLPCRLLVPG